MQFINKTTNETNGRLIIDDLLNDSWIAIKYINLNYAELRKLKYITPITALLLDEQQNLCCYCMKEITTSTTIEHIIPQEISLAKFHSYLTVDFLLNNVIHKDNFDRDTNLIPPEKYPHDISYHNLIASCDSNANCNHYRGNKDILPLIFDPNIQKKVVYDNEGRAYSSEYFNDLAATGISINKELRMYRKIWNELSQAIDSLEDLTEDDIDLIIFSLIDDPEFNKILNNYWSIPSKKPDLLKYKWFFYYYKINNNT